MFTSSLLNVSTHPESHNSSIDRSDPVLRDGNRCAWRVVRGRPVIGMMPVCVEVIRLPSVSCTWMGLILGWMLSHGMSVLNKLPFHPVSAIVTVSE